jgi:serine/threonine protein kinase
VFILCRIAATVLSGPDSRLLLGRARLVIQIPGYRIVRQLGRGGMATVYLAIQESVDREVALKVMSPALLVDPNFGERFLREARIAAKLHHRHVVGVHDVGRHGDLHYIAMEYLAGGPILSKDGQAKDVPFCLRATREIAAALGYAHSKGFVHRDVKPDNILLRDDGAFALTDFGIARASDSGHAHDAHRRRDRHAALHEPRAGARQAHRRARRPVQPRHRAARAAHRARARTRPTTRSRSASCT